MDTKIVMYFILLLFLFQFSITYSITLTYSPINIISEEYSTILSSNHNNVLYTVNKGLLVETISGNQPIIMLNNETTYNITYSSHLNYYQNTTINITINENIITVYTGIPNLIKVILYSSNQQQIVWAGYLSSPGYVNGYAYINGSGTLTLEYLNGSSIFNIAFNVTPSSKITKSLTLSLLNTESTIINSSLKNIIVNFTIPNEYEKYNLEYNSTNYTLPYSLAFSYISNSLLPSIIWKFNQNNLNITIIEFFGKNGSLVGFAKIISTSYSLNNSVFMSSSLLLIKTDNPYYNPKYLIEENIQGKTVLFGFTEGQDVESNVNITFSHTVFVNGKAGAIVNLTLDNVSYLILILSNGKYMNISITTPNNITIENITIGNTIFLSQKILIKNSSFTLLEVNPLYNSGIIVLKQLSNGSLTFLNSSNYFILNGKLYIFDSSSTSTYYIVYTSHPTNTLATTRTVDNILTTYSDNNSLIIISAIVVIILAIIAGIFAKKRSN
ncbi:MAG: hypothetical protein QXH75_05565 [Sulfolobaceae archaeon]